MEYKGRAFAMMHEDRIVLKLDGHDLDVSSNLGWQYFRPHGNRVYLQKWVEVPYYFQDAWPQLAERALDDLKGALGEEI